MSMNKLPNFTTFMESYEKYKSKTEDELDQEMFEKTQWSGMKFERESEWKDIIDNPEFASPVFKFENGDRVVVNRKGIFVKL